MTSTLKEANFQYFNHIKNMNNVINDNNCNQFDIYQNYIYMIKKMMKNIQNHALNADN